MFWIALSGILDLFHLSVGLLSAIAIVLWGKRSRSKQTELSLALLFHYIVSTMKYSLWLVWQIILAALHVSKLILSPSLKVAPQFISHQTKLKSNEAKTVFANSITLTPGTITVDIQEDSFVVHEIDRESSEGVRSGSIENEIQKIFSKEKHGTD